MLEDLHLSGDGLAVIEGAPGTGKTVVAIFLMKMLLDLGAWRGDEIELTDSGLEGLFTPENAETLRGLRIGLVVPQQSLRKSVQRVFSKTPGLASSMVMSPEQVGMAEEPWDLLIVDEAHRLMRQGTLPSAMVYNRRREINQRLLPDRDQDSITQWDWIREQRGLMQELVTPDL